MRFPISFVACAALLLALVSPPAPVEAALGRPLKPGQYCASLGAISEQCHMCCAQFGMEMSRIWLNRTRRSCLCKAARRRRASSAQQLYEHSHPQAPLERGPFGVQEGALASASASAAAGHY